MDKQSVAKRYAKALLELGSADGQAQDYGRQLQSLGAAWDTVPELRILENPGFTFAERRNLLDVLLPGFALSPLLAAFIKLLMDRGRIGLMGEVAAGYARLLDEQQGIKRAKVISARPLAPARLEELAQKLRQAVQGQVEIEVQEDKDLIGGLMVRIGDLVMDGSVRTQLTQIKDSLTRGDYA